MLIVATDRISAFDYILATGIPDKGRVLTQLSIFWFDFFRDVMPNHFLTANVATNIRRRCNRFRDQLEGRSMLVKRAKMIEIECVARGYISGSGWKEYRENGTVCGIQLPAGLRESDKLPEPIFTPATKAQSGHDENSVRGTWWIADRRRSRAAPLRDLTLDIYSQAAHIRGDARHHHRRHQVRIRLCGRPIGAGRRSADAGFLALLAGGTVQTGRTAVFSYDKQFVRDYLESIHWNKQPPAPSLPEEVAREDWREISSRPTTI